jgi:Tol biopolymer transport system component
MDTEPEEGQEVPDITEVSVPPLLEEERHEVVPKVRKKSGAWRRVGVAAAVLILLGIVGWFAGWFAPLIAQYNAATVTIRIRENDTYALQGVVITYRGSTATTDAAGTATLRSSKGTGELVSTFEGYATDKQTLTLRRGDNGTVSLSLTKVPDAVFAITGLLTDYVSGAALAGVQATVESKKVTSDSAGAILFEKLPAGSYTVKLVKEGYLTQEVVQELGAGKPAELKASLVPSGKVVFASNRNGGKRALYNASYDGTEVTTFITPVAGTEDYQPSPSPDGAWLAFLSTRDKIADAMVPSDFQPRLYVVSSDGKTIKRVADQQVGTTGAWGVSNRFLSFYGEGSGGYSSQFYDVTKGTIFDLGTSPFLQTMNNAGTAVYYATAHAAEGQQYDIMEANLVTGARRTLASGISNLNTYRELFVNSNDKELVYATESNGVAQVYLITIASAVTNTAPLTALPKSDTVDYLSPSGTQKAYIAVRDGKSDLFIATSDGTGELRLTTIGTVSSGLAPRWSASGKYLSFVSQREGETALYVVAASGGEIRKISDVTID